MGLESSGKKRPSAKPVHAGLAISVVCLGLALLLVAPLFNWAEANGAGGGLLKVAAWSLRTVFDFSGESAGWTRLLTVILWGIVIANGRRAIAGFGGAWRSLMGEASTPAGERRIWKLLLLHGYLFLIPVLALTTDWWHEPLAHSLEGRWAESYLPGSAAVGWWSFGLFLNRTAPFLLLVASIANLLAFVTMTRALTSLRLGKPLAAVKPVPSVPDYAHAWGLLGGLPGALLARHMFAPGLRRRMSLLGGMLAVLYLAPLWIPWWMMQAERAAARGPLSKSEPSEAVRAARVIQSRFGSRAAVARLTPGLESPDLHVFARAAYGLRTLGPEGHDAVESIFNALPTRRSLGERNLLLQTLEQVDPEWEYRPDAARFIEPLLEHLSLRWMSNLEPDLNPLWGSRYVTAYFRYELGSRVYYMPIEGSPLCEQCRALCQIAPDWSDSPPGQACLQSLTEFSAERAPVHPFKGNAAADVLLALKTVGREPQRGGPAGNSGAVPAGRMSW